MVSSPDATSLVAERLANCKRSPTEYNVHSLSHAVHTLPTTCDHLAMPLAAPFAWVALPGETGPSLPTRLPSHAPKTSVRLTSDHYC